MVSVKPLLLPSSVVFPGLYCVVDASASPLCARILSLVSYSRIDVSCFSCGGSEQCMLSS